MAANHTQNLNLPQWDALDPFKRSEFNDAFATLDEACADIPKVSVGSYTGSGTYGKSNKNTLSFDFAPKLIVIAKQQALNQEDYMAIVAGQENAHCFGITDGDGRCTLLWSDDGKTVSWYNSQNVYAQMNVSENVYCYSAIG